MSQIRSDASLDLIQDVSRAASGLKDQVAKTVVGQDEVIEQLFI